MVEKRIPVWIDTDPAIGLKERDVDDGIALIQAFHSPEIEIKGVSVVFGNTDLDKAFPIGLDIVSRFAPKGLRVFKGAASSGELGVETLASMALANALRAGPLTIIAIGPVTNVATVVKNHPELHGNIKEIISVAGRRPGQRFTTGSKNKKGHRDFNFEQDPAAFQILLDSKISLTLAPFEISSKVWITRSEITLWKNGNEATQFLSAPSYQWLKFWEDVFGVDGFNPFDALAVAHVTSPSMIKSEVLPAEIQTLPNDETEEKMQGTTVQKKPYLLVSKDFKTRRQIRYCYEVSDKFKMDLMRRLLTTRPFK